MLKRPNSKSLFSLLMLVALSVLFYACEQKESVNPQDQNLEQSLFKQHLEDNTQKIAAPDLGEGTYQVTGEQGTRIEIDNALVNADGERVRGAVDIVLIEIYTVDDMILNRKQTLADYDGQPGILESGGEVFVKAYQNGAELFADGNGTMNIFLPTENTGGPKEGMELFYGEEVGDQVIWQPTGEPIRVINNESRNGSDYLIAIQNILGWMNVDILYSLEGEAVDCLEVVIDCQEFCEATHNNSVVAVHVNSANSAFELQHDPQSNSFKLCGEQGESLPLGGVEVTFIIVIECPDGTMLVAIITVTVTPLNHVEVINCGQLTPMTHQEFEMALGALTQ